MKECKENISADLYEFYLKEISPEQKSRKRAIINLKTHLKKYSFQDLRQSIQNYKIRALNKEPQFRKGPANFFGKREPYFIDFLPENFEPHAGHNTGYNPKPQPSVDELMQ